MHDLNDLPYLSIKVYVVGAQKNRLSETVLLSTHNICFDWIIREEGNFYVHIFGLTGRECCIVNSSGQDKQTIASLYTVEPITTKS